MKRTIAAIALALLPAGAMADMIFEHGGHTYKLIETPMNWHGANEVAQSMSLRGEAGYLVRIDSEGENAEILSQILNHLSDEQLAATIATDGSETPFVWLGGSDFASEGQWVWSNNNDAFWLGDFNGVAVEDRYTNWGVQPDNANGGEHGLALGLGDWPEPFFDLGSKGQWNDLNLETPLMFLVEFDTVSDLQFGLEEPAFESIQSGIGAIRGWAVSSEGIQKIEVSIDDIYMFEVPHGGPHNNAEQRFPDLPGSDRAGYSTPLNFGALNKGRHSIKVSVTDKFGSKKHLSRPFSSIRFQSGFISKDSNIELGWANIYALEEQILIYGAEIDGRTYELLIEWDHESQNFKLKEIQGIETDAAEAEQ